MSVILDALRRGRRKTESSTAHPLAMRPTTARVPTGLGLGSTTPAAVRPTRAPWVAVAAVAVIVLGVWAIVQVARGLTTNQASPRTAAAANGHTQSAPAPSPATASSSLARSSIPPAAITPPVSELPSKPSSQTSRSAGTQFEQAIRAQGAGNLDEAARHYRAAIATDARNVEARNNLGLIYRARGQSDLAVEQFKQALAIDPRYVNARNSLAALLMDGGRFAEAREELTAGLAVDSRNVDLLVNLALVENSTQHQERAMELLLRAVGDRPMHAAAHYNLALLYDQREAFALAYDHYVDFLAYAGPEYQSVLPDVRHRLETLAPLVTAHTR